MTGPAGLRADRLTFRGLVVAEGSRLGQGRIFFCLETSGYKGKLCACVLCAHLLPFLGLVSRPILISGPKARWVSIYTQEAPGRAGDSP